MMALLFAEIIILGTALDKILHYSIPESMRETVRPGSMVSVGLGKRRVAGIVLSVGESPPDLPENITIRPIHEDLEPQPVVPEDLLALSRWIAEYYFYPLGEVLGFAVPVREPHKIGALRDGPRIRMVRLSGKTPGDPRMAESGRHVLQLLEQSGGELPVKALRQSIRNADYWLRKFEKNGTVSIEDREQAPLEPSGHETASGPGFELTDDQKLAFDTISRHLENPAFEPFVLYGVTGSGKTELYIRLIETALRNGKSALVLVPEIALSTQIEAIFRKRFGPLLAVWHSARTEADRRRQWAGILGGKTRIVLGARSAVLTPARNVGLIIVDEEHDPAYKQEDRLRYNARDVALMRGKILGIPVVLGSATPSLQTVHRVGVEQYRCVQLPSRILGRPQPTLEIVDMKREGARGAVLSHRLKDAVGQVLTEGRQAMLFLNRRGYARHFLCNACGHILQCISCSLTLTYHKKENCLRCHYCGWETGLPERCPQCGHAALFAHGFGTERVEKELRLLFPNSKLVRVDRDTMDSPEKLIEALDSVRTGRADILLGTQMIAKGHDFPGVTLVGVINADVGLQVPDFRAGENLVQLLFQVAGRAGRGEDPGVVILQTFNPGHYTIDSLLKMDYDGFCKTELESRKVLQYPPFSRLLKFLVTSGKEETAKGGAQLLAALCREKAAMLKDSGRHIAVLGPSPAVYVKLKNRFRWQVFIKTWQSSDMQSFVELVIESVKNHPDYRGVQITVDRDPASDI
ncbi:MAG: primosomal protein N' [Syntrophobacter sp.]